MPTKKHQFCIDAVYIFITRFILFSVIIVSSAPILANTNPIQEENAKPGTIEWQISHAADANEIEGYASATSVAPGGSIDLFVNATDPTYSISIYRLGWYGGLGGRLMASPIELNRQLQPAPNFDPVTRLLECNWNRSYTLTIPNSIANPWVSGIYVAKLTGSRGKQSHIMFVVRDDVRSTDILFQSSVTTFAAYNAWGGSSLYDHYPPGAGPAAVKVSFNRPYQGNGTAEFMAWEYRMVRFMEREGFDVSYSTNIDTHASGERLLNHRAFLSVGHDEYWTREMYDNIENARNKAVNLGFFGANTAYWQIRLEPSISGDANRTVVAYRFKTPDTDPLFPGPLSTVQWRDAVVNRPEAALVGVMYEYNSYDGDIVIKDCPGWLCEGTTIKSGDILRGVLGYEQDRLDASSPAGIIVIGASPYIKHGIGPVCCSHMTYYRATSGAGVFATGSMNWSWGLDTFGGPNIDADTQAKVQQITRNVLQKFSSRNPPIPTHPPSVTLTAPISGTTVESGSSITLTAAATDRDGQVTKVAFYANGEFLGVDRNAPFSFFWEKPARGAYVLTAKAFDNVGARATSSPVNISVKKQGLCKSDEDKDEDKCEED